MSPSIKNKKTLHWQGEKSMDIWKEILLKLLENEEYYRKSYH